MYHFKVILRRGDANGNVKSNFKAHASLFTLLGEEMILSQAMQYFGMDDKTSEPTTHTFPSKVKNLSRFDRSQIASEILKKYIEHHKYGTLLREESKALPPKDLEIKVLYKIVGKTAEGHLLLAPVQQIPIPTPSPPPPDTIYNYCSQLCHWALHFFHLNDTAKEGDVDRLVSNCKFNVPFFYSHSKLSKYLVENINFLLQVQCLLSPRMSLRVLEGAFVNARGGQGENTEADLVMEHSICNRKELIRGLGANKTDQAVLRVTQSADAIEQLVQTFDQVLQIPKTSSRHSKANTDIDREKIHLALKELQPFREIPGRTYKCFNNIQSSPFATINNTEMKAFINNIIKRLCRQ